MLDIEVLYEDNHFIAVNKRSSQIVQGDKTGDVPLVELVRQHLKEKYNKPGNVFSGLIHRIDRPVSGVVLFAKTSKGLERMSKVFQNRTVQKTYWAITEKAPNPSSGKLTHHLTRNQKKNKSFASSKPNSNSKEAELDYHVKGKGDRYCFVEVLPKTGRHHQIRAQMSAAGAILKGDVKYGAKRANKDLSIGLHARKLSFIHPIKKEPIEITAPVPKDPIWQAFERTAFE